MEFRRAHRCRQPPNTRAVQPPQFGDRHAVLGQRAGLVGAQDRGRAERLDGGSPPREHARAGDAPRAHRHEDGEHDRKLFRQHGHAERNAREHGIEPAAAEKPVEEHRDHADRAAHERQTGARVFASARCRRGGSVSSVLKDCPILPISLRGPVAVTSAMPAPRTISAPENTCGRSSPPGRAGVILGETARASLRTGTDSPVSSDSSACKSCACNNSASAGTRSPSAEHDQIAAHHFPTGDALAHAVADNERARARQVAQGLQHALGARLLHDGDDDGERGEGEQDERFLQVAEREVNRAARRAAAPASARAGLRERCETPSAARPRGNSL